MVTTTHVRIFLKTKKQLEKLKQHPRETIGDVIKNLVDEKGGKYV